MDGEILAGHEPEDYVPEQPEPEPKPEAKDPNEDRFARLESELKDTRSRLRDAETDVRTWHERATRGGRQEPEPEPEPEEIDIVDAISSGDKERARKAFKSLGFLAADEVEQIVEKRVNSARGAVTNEAALLSDYPDLADEESEFYEATATAYKELHRKGHKGDDLLELAADRAAARLGVQRAGAGKRGGRRDDRDDRDRGPRDRDNDERPSRRTAVEREDEGEPETDYERNRRVAAQSGVRSRPDASRGDDEMSTEQKIIIKKFGITEAAYRKRANRGVTLSGMDPRQRGRG